MTCSEYSNGSVQLGPITTWTKRSTTNWIFHSLGAPMQSATVGRKIRPNIDMSETSGDVKVRLSMRMSNDGMTWDTPVAIGTLTANADGPQFGSSFADLSSTLDGKRLVQFGVEAVNDIGSNLELARVAAQLDFQ